MTGEDSPYGALPVPVTHFPELDSAHAAFVTGYHQGLAKGQLFADEDRAHAILHARAVEMAGIAVRTAHARHGAGWAEEIRRQAEGVPE